jgi:8-oxo-dGTP diphosphatase
MYRFNIRVYGLLINDRQEVLVSDEEHAGFRFTKFPGGGLEFGEGLIDALKREFREELSLEAEVGELFYLTDFFQVSAFHPQHQVISVYYRVSCDCWDKIPVMEHKTFHPERENHRWIPVKALQKEDLDFPIDQVVAEKLHNGSF